ncbi:hypothetical protein OMAG_000068 [Candidatus Omnitrophus magneticus]|uniref:Uncharacterized protein n=1 Tax=Candidatus Omnitrophus magneticus TaxID=1609969 RepID=A0A0F0CRW0_9BACT|nr:hypothetical protein OMAG_000068 [Candidatus Omnitrophus magneticus]
MVNKNLYVESAPPFEKNIKYNNYSFSLVVQNSLLLSKYYSAKIVQQFFKKFNTDFVLNAVFYFLFYFILQNGGYIKRREESYENC